MSQTFFRRQILAEFADSVSVEHQFKQTYDQLTKRSSDQLGWTLLVPLAPLDEHHLSSLRIPSANEQKELDEIFLSLTKSHYAGSGRRGAPGTGRTCMTAVALTACRQ